MKRFFFLFFLFLFTLTSFAQELTVKSFERTYSLDGKKYSRNDANGDPCALIKVGLARQGATFEGNVVGNVRYEQSEYWVYMYTGSTKNLTVKVDGALPLRVNFQNYGINYLEPNVTYNLILQLPSSGPIQEDYNYFILKFSPSNAIVLFDEGSKTPEIISPGVAQILLKPGSHSYQVSRQGYRSKSKMFVMGNRRQEMSEHLEPLGSKLVVTNVTSDAEIYINDTKRGKGTWQGELPPSTYRVEARKDGYATQRQTVTLQHDSTKVVSFSALLPKAGSIDVNYQPVGAEVWIDNKRLGTSPDIFRNIAIGYHTVEIRKVGYKPASHAIAVKENQSTVVTGNLHVNNPTPSESQSSTSSFYVDANYQVGGLKGVGVTIGSLFSHINIELNWLLGLSESEKIEWHKESDNSFTGDVYTYKAMHYGMKIGLEFEFSDKFSCIPQMGIGVSSISGTATGSNSGKSDCYALPLTLGARFAIKFTPHFGFSVTPEYGFGVSKSDTFKKLAKESSKISGFGSGFNTRFGLFVSF